MGGAGGQIFVFGVHKWVKRRLKNYRLKNFLGELANNLFPGSIPYPQPLQRRAFLKLKRDNLMNVFKIY